MAKQDIIVQGRPDRACDAQALMSALSSAAYDLGNLVKNGASALEYLVANPSAGKEEMSQRLEDAASALDHASLLARRIIRLSQYRTIDSEPVYLADCLATIESFVRTSWDRRFFLDLQIAADLPEINCDLISLQDAVWKLLANARDAMPKGGVISLRAELCEVGATWGIALSVTDDGVGMSPETISRAFDPFFTAKSTGAAGMGLPMVERFVQAAGGRILIDSALARGTTITLLLPAHLPSSMRGGSAKRAGKNCFTRSCAYDSVD